MRVCSLLLVFAAFASLAAAEEYNPIGRRDPFQPAIEAPKPLAGASPLERVELSEIRLEGILSGISDPRATVTALGESFLVRKGSRIGKYGGRVARIAASELVVREESVTADGVTHVKETTIAIDREDRTEDRD